MIKFKELILENVKEPNPRAIHYFDLDDTLFSHDNHKLRVHVLDQHGRRVRSLTNQEYNTHQLPDNHSYDYREFRNSDLFGETAKPIKKTLSKLKALQKNGHKVEILTARQDLDDKDRFAHHMKKFGVDIDQVHVRRAGNLPGKTPDAKASVVRDAINRNGHNEVHLYDDSHENLNKFLSLKREHPEVEFNAHHVEHDPETGKVAITTRKV